MTFPSQNKPQFLSAAALLFTAMTMSAASPTAYVTLCCTVSSPVAVLSPQTLASKGTFFAGVMGDSLALSPDGSRAYVTSEVSPELQVIATSTGVVFATIPLPVGPGSAPYFVAASPDGKRVYVWAPFNSPSTLFAIDAKSFEIVHQVSTLLGALNFDPVLVSADSSQIYVENDGGNSTLGLQIIDAATLTLGAQVVIGQYSTGLVLAPNGEVLDSNADNQLVVIDPKNATIVNRFTLPPEGLSQPAVLAVSPDSSTAYVSFGAFGGPSILAVHVATGGTIFDAPVATYPSAAVVSSDGASLCLINGNATVSQFNIVLQSTVKVVDEPGALTGIAISPRDTSLYVLEEGDSGVASVDVSTRRVTQLSRGGTSLYTLAVQPNSGSLWVSQYAGSPSVISILDPTNVKFDKSIPGFAGYLAFSPDGTKLYVGEFDGLVILDASTFKVLGIVPFGGLQSLDQVIISPDGSKAYVSITEISGIKREPGNEYLAPGYIAVVDSSTYKANAAVAFPDGMGAFVVTPDGSMLVETANLGRVHLVSTSTNKIASTIQVTPANGFLSGVALSPDGTVAYVTDSENNAVDVINLAGMTQTATFPVGQAPVNILVTPDGSEALITTAQGLEVVSLSSQQVTATIALPSGVEDFIIVP